MHSVDCIEDNSKSGVKFWGVIADSYNSTPEEWYNNQIGALVQSNL
jgi:hypothetical protein